MDKLQKDTDCGLYKADFIAKLRSSLAVTGKTPFARLQPTGFDFVPQSVNCLFLSLGVCWWSVCVCVCVCVCAYVLQLSACVHVLQMIDPMHTIKNVVGRMVGTMKGDNAPADYGDGEGVNSPESIRERREAWRVTGAQQKVLDRLFALLPTPSGFRNLSHRLFANTGRLKMADFIHMAESWGAWVFRGVFAEREEKVLMALFDLLRRILRRHFDAFDPTLHAAVFAFLCMWEADGPPTDHTIVSPLSSANIIPVDVPLARTPRRWHRDVWFSHELVDVPIREVCMCVYSVCACVCCVCAVCVLCVSVCVCVCACVLGARIYAL
jgi:hypothetical protein